MNDFRPTPPYRDRRLIWCAAIVMLGAAFALVSVPTHLGVQVPETKIPGYDPSLVDLSGHENAWRVWLRAHDQFVTIHPQWLLTTALFILLAIFLGGILTAVWLALTTEPDSISE